MIFVIIGGASGSGKTGLSHHLLNKLKKTGTSAQILNMDDYYKECPKDVNLEDYRKNTNFDTPEMLHLDLLITHIGELHQGKSITKPIFDFKTNSRIDEEQVAPSDVIILEGIFAQYFYKKYWSSDVPVVTANIATDNYSDIIERRINRDMNERGRIRCDSIKQERKYVGPGFLRFTASSSMGADVYVTNEHSDGVEGQNFILDTAADEIIAVIGQKIEEINVVATQTKKSAPNPQELIAKSHLIAGTLFHTRKFEGHFSGVFGDFKGKFVREFSEEEAEKITASYKP
ncbi:uridine kinase [Legionella sp. PATHC038]|uniref:uridine kinase family protein n=1 Tax=Legionella sheltonii TaxID=2992041 RepID=UPI00224385C2|nr:uridine kinase [Legionella sp. PATHC038]MCW8400655.1 uridine kinase [Legionella sp. PATHC038]